MGFGGCYWTSCTCSIGKINPNLHTDLPSIDEPSAKAKDSDAMRSEAAFRLNIARSVLDLR